MSFEWSLERERELCQLWHDGLSASQIAERLGGLSRNAVIGKARRLNLNPKPASRQQPATAAWPAESVARPIHAQSDSPRAHCQWIDGDVPGDWSFCQAPKQLRSSYCAAHHARCYVARAPEALIAQERGR